MSASKATRAIAFAMDREPELWHDPEGEPYADVRQNDVRRTMPIASRVFRRWLSGVFYAETGEALGGQSASDAVDVLAASAVHAGGEREIHVRIAAEDGTLYLDLGNETWAAVEVDADGWRITGEPPVRFRRPRGLRPLPMPEKSDGAGWAALRDLLHLDGEDTWTLIVAWMLGTLNPTGSYPILALTGEQGVTKSWTGRILRSIIDPSAAPLRSAPREDRDLVIAAKNSHIVAFDNLSSIPEWLSDALCRIATGGGYSARQLYTDGEEVIFAARRPILLTSIEDVATRGDLADRTIGVSLPRVPEHKRMTETDVEAKLERIRPAVLGDVLDAVCTALYRQDRVRLEKLPRMADLAHWIVAAEPALPWEGAKFVDAYRHARDDMVETSIGADLVATAILDMVREQGAWQGTATELLAALDARRNGKPAPRDWPTTPQGLGGRLTRAAPLLRASDWDVERGDQMREAGTGRRLIHLAPSGDSPSQSSQPSRTSQSSRGRHAGNPHTSADCDNRDDCDDDSQYRAASDPPPEEQARREIQRALGGDLCK